MTSICASCTSFSLDSPTKSSAQKKPQWLRDHDFVVEFIRNQTSFATRTPPHCDQTVDIDLGKKGANRKILYWAATSSSSVLVKDAKQAYDRFENHGVVKLNKEGCGKLPMQCPQIYKTTQKGGRIEESFYRHFHVVMANDAENQWLPQIYTQAIVCKRPWKYVKERMHAGYAVLLNALPCEYYAKDHIPNSYQLFHTQVKKMSAKDLAQWMEEVIGLHYPKLKALLQSKKLSINEVPVVCYCAHEKCTASEMLEKELLKKGMVRVDSFPGGMKEYKKETC